MRATIEDTNGTSIARLTSHAEPGSVTVPFSGSYEPGGGQNGHKPTPVAAHPSPLATDDVLDVPAVAELLHVGRNTVYALVARNAIPHRRLGKQIRFNQVAIMRWLDSWSSQGAKKGQ